MTRTHRRVDQEKLACHSAYLQNQFVGEEEQRDDPAPVVDPITEQFLGHVAECFVRTVRRYLFDHAPNSLICIELIADQPQALRDLLNLPVLWH